MYECLFGKAPYSSATLKELVDKIQKQVPIEIPPRASISPGCRELLGRLLQHNPDRRISYEEFFSHEYLDLEHMPSKENYNKAVSLMKQAVSLEAARALRPALAAYGAALRYLLPAAAAQRDPLRRAALEDKLRRYMERAEEIKRILKEEKDPPSNSSQPSDNYNFHTNEAQAVIEENTKVDPPQNDVDVPVEESEESKSRGKERRGALSRLLRRPAPGADTTDDEGAQKCDANDTNCKIS
ncbi:unnamed protein product, partial [Brenthis ino]